MRQCTAPFAAVQTEQHWTRTLIKCWLAQYISCIALELLVTIPNKRCGVPCPTGGVVYLRVDSVIRLRPWRRTPSQLGRNV